MNSQETDLRSGFVLAASLHLINKKSVTDLKQQIARKYQEKDSKANLQNNFDYELFRPNIVIDYDKPYIEEEITEARIQNIMLR